MVQSFSQLPRPLIVGSVRQKTADAAIAEIQAEEAVGARAFILHIQMMDAQYHTFADFQKIAACTKCPIMAINYRTEGGPDDAHRLEVQREAVRAGFRSVDIPMYIFDEDTQASLAGCDLPFVSANPNEVSMRPDVIQKQKALVAEFQQMGAEVLMSAHVMVDFSCEQGIALAKEIRSRGADIVKIISTCADEAQVLEILRTNLALQTAIDVPFLYTNAGAHNRYIRFNAPLFGSMLVFGHASYSELSNREKPLIADLVQFYNMMEVPQ